jgi:hypothetical protein
MTDQSKIDAEKQVEQMQFKASHKFAEIEEGFREELSFMNDLVGHMVIEARGKEEELLVEVLQDHLGRLVTTDDFKDCEMKHYEARPNEYIFAHKGVDLGVVTKETRFAYDPGDFQRNMYKIEQLISFRKIKQP